MAYQNYSPNRGNSFQRPRPAPQPAPEIRALPLPEDYVDAAEAVMRRLANNNRKITFDAIYTGYLGSERQIALMEDSEGLCHGSKAVGIYQRYRK